MIDVARGSEWRKWDLHIHTPAPFDWKGAQLWTMSEDQRDEFWRQFLVTIQSSDVAGFGIVDH